jgi:hypothetical protein
MSAQSIEQPYPIFTDADGAPLEAGYIWIGVENLNPITDPVAVYWDAALTQPAVQPIRTAGGYPVNAGTPARLYTLAAYSILVQDRNGVTVYSSARGNTDIDIILGVGQWLTVTGTNTILGSSSVSAGSYAAGQTFRFVSAGANTGAVTLNVNGLGPKAITKSGTTALVSGDIPASAVVQVSYDGTQFQLVNPIYSYLSAAAQRAAIGAAASGANTDITSLAAPALGAATATTQAAGTNGTNVATTAFVQNRAWVRFDGTQAIPANMIKAAWNVTSITDVGLGSYQVNFSTAMADANFCALVSINNVTGGSSIVQPYVTIPTVSTSVSIITLQNSGASPADTETHVAVFR